MSRDSGPPRIRSSVTRNSTVALLLGHGRTPVLRDEATAAPPSPKERATEEIEPARRVIQELVHGRKTTVDSHLLSRLFLYDVARSSRGYFVRADLADHRHGFADRYTEAAIADGAFAAAAKRAFGTAPTTEQMAGFDTSRNAILGKTTEPAPPVHREMPALARYIDVLIPTDRLAAFGKKYSLKRSRTGKADLGRMKLLAGIEDSLEAARDQWKDIEAALDPDFMRKAKIGPRALESMLDSEYFRLRLATELANASEAKWLVAAVRDLQEAEELIAIWRPEDEEAPAPLVEKGTPEKWAKTLPVPARRLIGRVDKESAESSKHLSTSKFRPRELHPDDPLQFILEAYDPSSGFKLSGVFEGSTVTGGMTLDMGHSKIFVLHADELGVTYQDLKNRKLYWQYGPAFDQRYRLSVLTVAAKQAMPIVNLTSAMFRVAGIVLWPFRVFTAAEVLDTGLQIKQHEAELRRLIVDMSENVKAIWDLAGDYLLDSVQDADLRKLLGLLKLDVEAEDLVYYSLKLIWNVLKVKYGLRGLSENGPIEKGFEAFKNGLKRSWKIKKAVFSVISSAAGAAGSVGVKVDHKKLKQAAEDALRAEGVPNASRHAEAFAKLTPSQRDELLAQMDVLLRNVDELESIITKIVGRVRDTRERSKLAD